VITAQDIHYSDLFNISHDGLEQSDTFTSHPTPGRTFFARLQLKF
jgi:hypothetical protein